MLPAPVYIRVLLLLLLLLGHQLYHRQLFILLIAVADAVIVIFRRQFFPLLESSIKRFKSKRGTRYIVTPFFLFCHTAVSSLAR